MVPRAKWRWEIVPKPSELEAFKPLRKCANHSPRRRHARWAELLWNSFGVDATTRVLQGLGEEGRLIRQCLPNDVWLDGYAQQDLDAVARRLNERPRKVLEFRSLAHDFMELMH